jgi:membrane protease YdiL (CAAX protease family)
MNPLHERIRRLTPGVEFLIVLVWAFGMPIFSSIVAVLGAGAESAHAVFNDEALLSILILEIVQTAFLVWFLRIRGWTLEKIGLRVTWRGTAWGLVLLAVTYVVTIGVQALAQIILPIDHALAAEQYPRAARGLSMQLVFLTSTVNGIFEEVFVAGYIITALRERRGEWIAINVSTVVRMLYHLYQGPIGIITVVPMGLLYGYTFVRTRQLWPLIVAHVLVDIIGLSFATA